MVTPIQSIAAKPHEMELGEVQFRGRTYVAILHFQDEEEGAPLPITKAMEGAKDVFHQHLQDMLNTFNQTIIPEETVLGHISNAGLTVEKGEQVFSHEVLKTQEAWKILTMLLKNPEIAFHKKPVKLENTTELELTPEESLELCQNIGRKIQEAIRADKQNIEFEDTEKKLLAQLKCSNLSQGIVDFEESDRFSSLLYNLRSS